MAIGIFIFIFVYILCIYTYIDIDIDIYIYVCMYVFLCENMINHNILGGHIFGQTQELRHCESSTDPKSRSMRPSHKNQNPHWGRIV